MTSETRDRKSMLELLRKMLLVRAFEEKTGDLFREKEITGFIHLSSGEEASSVGTCSVLRPDDYVVSNHRGHGHMIAKGADPGRMFAELFGRATGYCKGKGGSMHIADFSIGVLGANGVVGGGFPIAVGAAISAKLRKTDQVVVVFFGDGSANRGTFHEAANMAAVWRLPLVFVCENNLYASTTPVARALAGGSVARRAAAYAMPGRRVNGNDVLLVRKAVGAAVRRARAGQGPSIVENMTYRYRGHFEGDPQRYRSPREVETWRKKADPIDRFVRWLKKQSLLSDRKERDLRAEVAGIVEQAVGSARRAPLPRPQDALEDLYVNA
jgi:pyruvate dehydrogenase E1 component alpha subunit